MKKTIALSVLMLSSVCLFSHDAACRSVFAVIDSIEAGVASVFFAEDQKSYRVPESIFPEHAREGMWYAVTVRFQKELTEMSTERIRRMLTGLLEDGESMPQAVDSIHDSQPPGSGSEQEE